MEASVAVPPAEPEASFDGAAEATRSTEELFQWSGYVHVGKGADECEHGVDGKCTNQEHFHAWVCLPNPYQIRDITDKARAAKARCRRALRDSASDAHAVLEDELDALREPENYEGVMQALADTAVDKQLIEIINDLQKNERFEHYDQDAQEFRRLQDIPEDERDPEEWERLQADMLAYAEALRLEVEKRTDAEMQHLRAKPQDEVIELERRRRIDTDSNEHYLHTYYTWAIYTGTREPTTNGFPSERKFKTPEAQKVAPPEVIVAVREKIRTLEERTVAARGGGASGNS